jgi:hypothetical protein
VQVQVQVVSKQEAEVVLDVDVEEVIVVDVVVVVQEDVEEVIKVIKMNGFQLLNLAVLSKMEK